MGTSGEKIPTDHGRTMVQQVTTPALADPAGNAERIVGGGTVVEIGNE